MTLPTVASGKDGIYNANITIDSGPTVSAVTVTPSPTNVAPAISATFTASTNAEYFIDSPGTPGTGTAMTVSGGTSATATMTSAQFTPLTQGTHYVYVEAKDAGGIWSSPYSSYMTFVKDTVGPVVPVFTVTPNTTNVGPTITVTNLPDSSGVGAAEYFLNNSTGTPGTGTPLTVSPVGGTSVTATGTITTALFNALPAGTNTVYVDAQDSLGNWSAAKKSLTFFKDVTPPTITVLTANPTTATATSPYFSMTVTDNKGIAGAEYFIDAAGTPGTGTAISISGTTIASTSFSLASFSSIIDGPHTLIAEAKDTAGNWSATNSAGFIKDQYIPSVTLTPPTSPTHVSPIVFTATFTTPVTFPYDASKIVVSGGTVGTITGGPTVFSIPVIPTADPSPQTGESVSLQLLAGAAQSTNPNYNSQYDLSLASFQQTVTFDDVAPALTSEAFYNGYTSAIFPTGTAIVPGVYYQLRLGFNEPVVVTGTSAVTLNASGMTMSYSYGSGSNTLTYSATVTAGQSSAVPLDIASISGTLADAAGNAAVIPPASSSDALYAQNITVHPTDDVAPVTTAATVNNSYGGISPNAAGWFNTSPIYVTFSATDLGSGVAHTYYTIDAGAQQTWTGTHAPITGTGAHTVQYWSVDNAGNTESPAKTLMVNIDTTQPVVTLNQPPNGSYGTPLTLTGTWTGGPSGLDATTPLTVYMWDFVDNYSYVTVGTVTSPSATINAGTWSYTFTPTTAYWGNSILTPVENSNWTFSVFATSGAGRGGNSVSSNSGGNVTYGTPPTANFSAGSGTGATGTGILTNGFVTGVNITSGGSGYTGPFQVSFTGGGGFNAYGTANVSGGSVTSVTMNMVTITKAATSITMVAQDATYDGSPHGATAEVTGPLLDQFLTVTYVGINGTTYGPSTSPDQCRAVHGFRPLRWQHQLPLQRWICQLHHRPG